MPLFFGGTNGGGSSGSSSKAATDSSVSSATPSSGALSNNGGCATKQWKTFQRNLNLWGYQRVSKGPQKDVVSHPLFVRGYPVLSTQMRRCTFKGTGRGNRAPPHALVQKKTSKKTKNNNKKDTNSSKLDDLAKEASEAYEGLQQAKTSTPTPTPTDNAGATVVEGSDGSAQLARKSSSSSFIMWPNSSSAATGAATAVHPNASYHIPPSCVTSSSSSATGAAAGETESADVVGMVAKMKEIQKQKELQSLISQLHGSGTPATAAVSSLIGTNRGIIAGGSAGLGLIPPATVNVNHAAKSTAAASTGGGIFLPQQQLSPLSSSLSSSSPKETLAQVSLHQPTAADSLQADDLISLLQHRKRLIEDQRKQDLELVKRYVFLQHEQQQQHRQQQQAVHLPQATGGDIDNRTALLQLIMSQLQTQQQEPAATAPPPAVPRSIGRI